MADEPNFFRYNNRNSGSDWGQGFVLALLLHVFQLPLSFFTHNLSIVYLGFSQLIYVVPAIILFGRRGDKGLVIGLIMGAALTFLLSPLCAAVYYH